jgi:rhodanese-related sulfurtransferase
VLVDVRTAKEYVEGHLQGATNVVWGDDFEKQWNAARIKKRFTVAIYCRSGRRSNAAASALVKMGYKVKKISDFSSLAVRLSGIRDTGVVVLLLNGSGNVIMQQRAKNNAVKFNYVAPGKYYLRAYVDANGNNQWDTGDYHADRQPEDVYFYSEEIECKEKWDVSREWNVNARPRFRQKPQALVKTKSEQQRKVQNRNAQRAKELGKEYIQKKTGVRL